MNLFKRLFKSSPDRGTQKYIQTMERIEQSIKFNLSDLVNLTSELTNLKNEVKGLREDMNKVNELISNLRWLE